MKFNFINDIKNKFILFKNGEENNVYLFSKNINQILNIFLQQANASWSAKTT